VQNVLSAMKKQPPARREKTAFDLKWIVAGLAGLLFLAAYLPKHPIKETKQMVQQLLARRLYKRKQAQSLSATKSS
jgi:mxaL protein